MKKFLSIFLAVAFVFSAMCMSVLADKTHPGADAIVAGEQYWVVGQQGKDDSLDNGVTDPSGNTSANITVNFNDHQNGNADPESTIHNRYAIDITYGSLIIDLTNITAVDGNNATDTIEFVWDVNKHMYVPYNSETGVATNPVETYEIVINEAFYLTNHSDLEIYYTPEVEVATNYNTILQLQIRSAIANVTDSDNPGTFMIQRATAGDYSTGANGLATNGIAHDIVALPAATGATGTQADWLAVINSLSATLTDDEIAGGAVIGTLTINVKATLAQGETAYNATATANPAP